MKLCNVHKKETAASEALARRERERGREGGAKMGQRRAKNVEGSALLAPLACISSNEPRSQSHRRTRSGSISAAERDPAQKENAVPPSKGEEYGAFARALFSNLRASGCPRGAEDSCARKRQPRGLAGGQGCADENEKSGTGDDATSGQLHLPLGTPHAGPNRLAHVSVQAGVNAGDGFACDMGNREACPLPVPEAGADIPLPADAVLPTLQEAYKKLHRKYKRHKARELGVASKLLEEQQHHNTESTKAAESCIEELRKENLHLRRQIEESGVQAVLNRLRWLEREYIESQDNLAKEHARNVELLQHISEIESSAAMALKRQAPGWMDASQPAPFDVQAGHEEAPMQDAVFPPCQQPQEPFSQCPTPEQGLCKNSINRRPRECPLDNEIGEHPRLPGLSRPACKFHNVCVQTDKDLQEGPEGVKPSGPSPDCLNPPSPTPGNKLSTTVACHVASSSCVKAVPEMSPGFQACSSEVTHMYMDLRKGFLAESRLLQELVQQLTELRLVLDTKGKELGEPPKLIFTHLSTGFSFKLENASEDETWLTEGRQGALECQVLCLGTLVKQAPAWMREDITFAIDQFQLFICRLLRATNGGKY